MRNEPDWITYRIFNPYSTQYLLLTHTILEDFEISTKGRGIKVIKLRLRILLKDQSSGRGYITAHPSHTH